MIRVACHRSGTAVALGSNRYLIAEFLRSHASSDSGLEACLRSVVLFCYMHRVPHVVIILSKYCPNLPTVIGPTPPGTGVI